MSRSVGNCELECKLNLLITEKFKAAYGFDGRNPCQFSGGARNFPLLKPLCLKLEWSVSPCFARGPRLNLPKPTLHVTPRSCTVCVLHITMKLSPLPSATLAGHRGKLAVAPAQVVKRPFFGRALVAGESLPWPEYR